MTDEQNKPVRCREEQIVDLGARIFVGMRNHTDSMCGAQHHIEEAEARGAAEQRRKDAALTRAQHFLRDQAEAQDRLPERDDIKKWQEDQSEFFTADILEIVTEYAAWRDKKDAEGQEPVAWVNPHHLPDGEYQRVKTVLWDQQADGCTLPLYTHPANVAALEAALKSIGDEVLEGAEPFRHAVVRILKTVGIDPLNGAEPDDPQSELEDRIVELEAREERDGWQYLTENTSSDSGLPSCRLNFMFQEGDSRERIEETASAFGIEVCWDVTDWDWQGPPEEMEELSADDLAKCAPRIDLTDAGWKLVDAWDTEDGEIVRMYARPIGAALTREGGV